MKIVRERPCQRRHHRVKAPLFVEFQGVVHRATDWSLGGLRLDGFPQALPDVDTEISLTLSLPFQGFEVVYPVRARVVRIVEETSTFAVEFTELGERESALMEHFIEQLIRGSMMPVEDTIQRIDIPVTPVSTQPDVNPSSAIPLRRWPVKTVIMTSLYMVLGLFIITYVGLMIYANYFRLEIETAVVTVPMETSVTSVDGMVTRVEAKENQTVRAGQPLIWIEDPRLERDITVVEAEVERRRADLELNRQNLANALRNLAEFMRIETAVAPFDGRLQEIVIGEGKTASRGETVAWLQDPALERQIAITEAEVGRRQADLDHYRQNLTNALNSLADFMKTETVITPFDGRFLEIVVEEGQAVRKGEIVAWLQDPELERQIAITDADVGKRRAELDQAQRRMIAARNQIAEYRRIDENQIKELKFEIESLITKRAAALAARTRIQKLLKQGYATRSQFEEVDAKYQDAAAELSQRQVRLREKVELAEAGGVRYYNGDRFVADLEELKSQIEFARDSLDVATNKHLVLIELRRRLVVTAPFDGMIKRYLKTPNTPIIKGDPLVILERTDVTGFSSMLNTLHTDDARAVRKRLTLFALNYGAGQTSSGAVRDGEQLLSDVQDWRAKADFAVDTLTVAKGKHKVLVAQRQRLAVTAPFDGVVRSYLKPLDASIIKGDPLVVFERMDESGFASVFKVLGKEDVKALREQLARFDRKEDVVETSAGGVRDGEKILTEVHRWRAKVDFAVETLLVARRKHKNLSAHREKLVILAPYDGILRTILKRPGSAVVKGDGLAVFERNSDSVIEAYLNQEEVLQVGLGDEALVYLPALNRRITATVVDVDRTSAFVDEQRSKYTWRGPEDRSALVTLAFNLDEIPVASLTAGMPAVVIFERQYTSELIEGIAGQIDAVVEDIRVNTFPEAEAAPDDRNEFRP